ncbi:MAG: OPT family oligopeptide transporter [Pirellulales bacterium]
MAESSTPEAAAGKNQAAASHQPYVPDEVVLKEFTWSAVLVGTALGIVFGASSLYLVLKVGMTISASIPVAVLSITLFRVCSKVFAIRRATILENNIVQTTGSAGESIAFGVGVTMPALMLLGFEMEITRVMLVSVLGGILGILMMIPLRRAFIVKQHGVLKYPEGTACADVLIVGEQGGSSAKTVFLGFGIAFLYQFLWQGMKLWKEIPDRALAWFKGATPAVEVNPALLGVGYIIGTKISCIMVAGGVLASFVLIPAIHFFGDGLATALYPATVPIRDMSEEQVWRAYVLYIGTGAVAAGGIVSLFRALPLIIGSIKAGLADVRWSPGAGEKRLAGRTDRDLPIRLVGVSTMVLILAIWLTLPLGTLFGWVNFVGAILIVLFGFLFVTVSSRLTGEIGSSSNPISGMTVATLLLTCLVFLTLNWTEPQHRLVALSVAAIVCIASSNGGTTSQDLKTGFLVGATPKYQQWAILVGAVSSALVIGWILIVLNDASTVYTTRNLPVLKKPLDVAKLTDRGYAPNDDTEYYVWRAREGEMAKVPQGKYLVDAKGQIKYLVDPGINGSISRRDDGTEVQKFKAPQARLMALITDGILNQKLPWALVLLGVSIAAVLELCGVPSLPFAVGVYLPLSSSTPIFVGGLVRYVVEKWGGNGAGEAQSETESDMSPGVLLSTGYIAGGAIAGVLLACLSFEVVSQYLTVWQYRSQTVTESTPLETLYREAALDDLGLAGQSLSIAEEKEVAKRTTAIEELNADQLARYVKVAKGSVLTLPKHEQYRAVQDTILGEIALETLGRAKMAQTLFDLNKDRLKLPTSLPAGASLKLPQRTWPALAAFGVLAVVLTMVGLRRSKEPESKE